MNRIFTIFFSLFFAFATVGFTVTKHYCGGKLASIGLFHNGGCTCGDMADDSNCCKNETEVIKVTDQYVSTTIEHVNLYQSLILPSFHSSIIPFFHDLTTLQFITPPPLLNRPFNSLFCTFLL